MSTGSPVPATPTAVLPKKGRPHAEVVAMLEAARAGDADWRRGRTGSLVYFAGDDVLRLIQEAYTRYIHENGLGTERAFPSLRKFETEVVAITGDLLGCPGAAGSITTGGTESILLAVKTARDWARTHRIGVREPDMVMPVTAHPAFNKAAHLFGVKAIRTPVRDDFTADVAAMRRAVSPSTILLVGSAPGYPHGVIDPISELAALAREAGTLLHVDACIGGFFLPFLRRLGYHIPPFDFSVAGVSSMSADLHKYGYTAKGASVILYRDPELFRHQIFAFQDWPMGLYQTPNLLGTRPGGAIAAAWATMHFLGEDGYLRLVQECMDITREFMDGIHRIPDLEIWGKPVMTVFAYGSRKLDIYAIADGLTARGWYVNRQVFPPSIHLVVTPAHRAAVKEYLADLEQVTFGVARGEIRASGQQVTYS